VETVKEGLLWFVEIVLVCLLAVFLVCYFGRKVSNIGSAMEPMMENGDVVLVNQVVYNVSQPKRYDVVVFKPNGNENEQYYIRRIIGLPGETIQITDGKILVDGEEIDESRLHVTELEDAGIASDPVTLGGDEYFVLADNRLELSDSRDADIGNVKKEDIYGKAWLIWSPKSNFGLIRYK
jgi:signal peptidase I